MADKVCCIGASVTYVKTSDVLGDCVEHLLKNVDKQIAQKYCRLIAAFCTDAGSPTSSTLSCVLEELTIKDAKAANLLAGLRVLLKLQQTTDWCGNPC